jgi:molybdopterin-guanine dinucleotide biosynthesis protein A
MIRERDVTGLILAGGLATRMGGVDKGLQDLAGKPLTQHLIERLSPQLHPLLISANRNQERYRAFGHPVLGDADPAAALGPLAGILAGMRAAASPYLLCAPCDLPFLPTSLLHDLLAAANACKPPAVIAYAASPAGDGTWREHPVCALLACALADDLQDYLAQGGRKVRAWYARHNPVEAKFTDERAFYNINSLQALQRAQHADKPGPRGTLA